MAAALVVIPLVIPIQFSIFDLHPEQDRRGILLLPGGTGTSFSEEPHWGTFLSNQPRYITDRLGSHLGT